MVCDIHNIIFIPYDDVMEEVHQLLDISAPTKPQYSSLQEYNNLLGTFANYYGYLIELWGVVQRAYRNDKTAGVELMSKRDLLYEASRAIKLKYEATSRVISVIKMDLDIGG